MPHRQRPTGQAEPAANVHVLTGREFFPDLISGPFNNGLAVVFAVAAALAVLAALASLFRGPRDAGSKKEGPDADAIDRGRLGVR